MSVVLERRLRLKSLEDVAHMMHTRKTDSELTQISPMKVEGYSSRFELGDTGIELTKFSSYVASGTWREGYIPLGIWLESEECNTFNGIPIQTGDIGWMPSGLERRSVYKGAFEVIILMIPEAKVEQIFELRGVSGFVKKMKQAKFYRPSEIMLQTLVPTMKIVASRMRDQGHLFASNHSYNYVFDFVSNSLVDATLRIKGIDCNIYTGQMNYSATFKKIEDLIRNETEGTLTINQICSELRLSRRTLYRAVENSVGISPSDYLRYWRLCRAREDLLKLKFVNVTDCAMRWGFFDAGRFAGYYKMLFNELPSTTVSRILG